jgi:hypothetical protein
MKFVQHAKLPMIAVSILLIGSLTFAEPAAKAKKHSTPSYAKKHSSAKLHYGKRHPTKKRKPRGQQAIDNERAHQIQAALVREHYLNGEPSGNWDTATQEAMRHYQSDQGWQTKQVPDSRALIRLGLGPNRDHLLNPESAMLTGSAPMQTARAGAVASRGSAPLPSAASVPSSAVSASPDLSSSR